MRRRLTSSARTSTKGAGSTRAFRLPCFYERFSARRKLVILEANLGDRRIVLLRLRFVATLRFAQTDRRRKKAGSAELDSAEPFNVIDLIEALLAVQTRSLSNRRTDPRNNQANEEQHQEHEKQYLCDIACRACDSTKAEYRGDQSDHQKCECPT